MARCNMKVFLFVCFIAVTMVILFGLYQWKQNIVTGKQYIDNNVYDTTILGKCHYKIFRHYAIVINFNFNMYGHADLVKEIYVDVFGSVITCGPRASYNSAHKDPDIEFDVNKGDYSYYCMVLAMQKYPDFKGYFYGNDDMIINWWTMIEFDLQKVWHGTKTVDFSQLAYGNVIRKKWIWWRTDSGISACQKYYEHLKSLATSPDRFMKSNFDIYLKNGDGEARCAKGWSDFFYVPKKFAKQFVKLGDVAFKNKLYLEIAVHNILLSLVPKHDLLVVDGKYLPDEGVVDYKSDKFWAVYNHQVAFIHPFKFNADYFFMSRRRFKDIVLRFVQKLTSC